MKWNFTPYNLSRWNSSKERVLFVAAEPNGNNPNSGTPDMGDWFRTANHSNNFHDNKLFHNRCKIILNGILNPIDENEALNSFRFMDLKATQGGAKSSEKEVAEYVNFNLDEVLEYFQSSNEEFGIAPTIIVVLGNNTQNVFEQTVKPIILKNKIKSLKHIYMPHPSAQTVVNEYLTKASSDINSKLVPISFRPHRWFCMGKEKHGWAVYK